MTKYFFLWVLEKAEGLNKYGGGRGHMFYFLVFCYFYYFVSFFVTFCIIVDRGRGPWVFLGVFLIINYFILFIYNCWREEGTWVFFFFFWVLNYLESFVTHCWLWIEEGRHGFSSDRFWLSKGGGGVNLFIDF